MIVKILSFNLIFWLIATSLLFLNNWGNAQNHLDIAIVRHAYVYVLSCLLSYILFTIYRWHFFIELKDKLPAFVIMSIAAALITAIVVNPITYLMIGYEFSSIGERVATTDTLYFALFYFIWSILLQRLLPVEPNTGSCSKDLLSITAQVHIFISLDRRITSIKIK